MNSIQAKAVVIGASAGGLEALTAVLSPLPANYPLPILVVLHLPPDKDSLLAELLRNKCSLQVREVEDKIALTPGTIYVAPPDYHVLVEPDARVSLSSDEPVLFSRPSIDVLFESAADAYPGGIVGVVLTGANSDGAEGLRTIAQAGGVALVQDPATAYATAMPQAALDTCPGARCLSLDGIAAKLMEARA